MGGGEHPLFIDQHTSTVELVTPEQGHLPRVRASCTWDSINNLLPTLVTLGWIEIRKKTWVASIKGAEEAANVFGEKDGKRQRGMRNAEAEVRNSAEKAGHGDGERQREPGHKPRRNIVSGDNSRN